MPNKICADIASAYNHFVKAEKSWRADFNIAGKDGEALRIAHSGMKEVSESFEAVENLLGCSHEKAKEILKEDFFGVEDLEITLGFKPNIKIPKIKFTEEQLKEAQAHGEMLVLRIGEDNEGRPMTMKRILEIMAERMPEGEKLLYKQIQANKPAKDHDFVYENEDNELFTKTGLKTQWVLVSKEFAPNTTNMNYALQTMELYKMMKERNLMTPDEEKENVDLENKLKQLCEKMAVNWETQNIDDIDKYRKNKKSVARELADLPINQKHRRSAIGILFDWVVRFKSRKGDRGQLVDLYDCSNTVSSSGLLVDIGLFGSTGAVVSWSGPGRNAHRLGVVFVRGLPDR
jgi:hypothetical protein